MTAMQTRLITAVLTMLAAASLFACSADSKLTGAQMAANASGSGAAGTMSTTPHAGASAAPGSSQISAAGSGTSMSAVRGEPSRPCHLAA
jgi:hypothetical protein